jgi:hypothetical protein
MELYTPQVYQPKVEYTSLQDENIEERLRPLMYY